MTFNFDKTMSLYIPRVDTRTLPRGNRHAEAEYEAMAADFIGKQFKYQRIGQVSRVDLLKKQTPQGCDFFIAFVHFSEWFDTPQAKVLQHEIHTAGLKAKLQFHEKWYWIVNENKTPLTATEASLHKTIYEQAKQVGLLNEAVDYLKSMKTIPKAIAEETLQRTAQAGFGITWGNMMNPPLLTRQQASAVAPHITWNTAENFLPLWTQDGPIHLPHIQEEERPISSPPTEAGELSLSPLPLIRSDAQYICDHENLRTPAPLVDLPPPLVHSESNICPQEVRLTPRDLFGANAPTQWSSYSSAADDN